MTDFVEKPISFWIDSTPQSQFPSLQGSVSVDVAIVGAGIAGITAATLLKRAGKTVAVIEAARVGTGVSGHTTAKVTALHQLIYAELIKQQGETKARLYAESNQAAVEQVAQLIEQDGIECDFSRQSAYTFAESDDTLGQVEEEVEAALKLGLPVALVQATSLPFPIAGAIKLDRQVQFHVRKYLMHLANSIPGSGSYVFEQSRVQHVEEGQPCEVLTDRGTVQAKDVIVTTNLPILNQGLFFAKAYPKRSYLIGVPIDPAAAPVGMYIGAGSDYYSIRTTPYGDRLLLLIGGGGHKVGTVTHTQERYHKLAAFAQSRFGIDSIAYRWSTQDMVSFDKLPFIGKLTPFNNHIYVATGFSLWGMSKGTLSGMLLTDMILGRENPWAELYDATRATPFITPQSIKENIEVGVHWLGDRLKGLQTSSTRDVAQGEGKLLTLDGEKVAVYRDHQGKCHGVSAVCTHLGCIVDWNDAERSWDCPCHGARFDYDGAVLHGPAINPLKQKVVEGVEG
ncbi:MAG: FAD-dependent oxidoreductase [Leptolyngbyaceae cyanobacterium SL_7_1]|nr:FAD-dependent oxidoreductase [Leptolyngbyaceae cyanobacterium SL_7_1]